MRRLPRDRGDWDQLVATVACGGGVESGIEGKMVSRACVWVGFVSASWALGFLGRLVQGGLLLFFCLNLFSFFLFRKTNAKV